jgi:tRNA(Met) C34 N-acetyltransferase TmcA
LNQYSYLGEIFVARHSEKQYMDAARIIYLIMDNITQTDTHALTSLAERVKKNFSANLIERILMWQRHSTEEKAKTKRELVRGLSKIRQKETEKFQEKDSNQTQDVVFEDDSEENNTPQEPSESSESSEEETEEPPQAEETDNEDPQQEETIEITSETVTEESDEEDTTEQG